MTKAVYYAFDELLVIYTDFDHVITKRRMYRIDQRGESSESVVLGRVSSIYGPAQNWLAESAPANENPLMFLGAITRGVLL